jgi:FSR family fosmidomycin resistance protein-like MFS transporter
MEARVLTALVFAKSWYHAGITNFYAFFYLEEAYGLIKEKAILYIFFFLAAGAVETFVGDH